MSLRVFAPEIVSQDSRLGLVSVLGQFDSEDITHVLVCRNNKFRHREPHALCEVAG